MSDIESHIDTTVDCAKYEVLTGGKKTAFVTSKGK